MLIPRGDEYIAAVQNPRTAFGDAELKDCSPESDQFGIPKPYSGGFTATFHLTHHPREWAVRCFTRSISDLQERYAAIDHFLARNAAGSFVGTFYLAQGIRIGGQWYPIIKMQWVKGDTLNAFIEKNIGNPGRIKKLIPEFLALVQRLQHLQMAHGDLQHGNILVRDGKLVLIDYDGMFLPKLSRLKTNEIGHPNYQHPARKAGYYDASIDHFSSIVIYLGLRAISESPKLWARHNDSENILFRAEDFVDLARSALLRELSALPALSAEIDKFRGVCKLPFPDVPDLETFIAGRFRHPEATVSTGATPAALKVVPPTAPSRTASAAPPPKPAVAPPTLKVVPPVAAPKAAPPGAVLDGSNVELLRRHVGQRVDVVGFVTQFHVSGKGFGRPLVLLNFGAHPNHTFTTVLRDRAVRAYQRSRVDPQGFVGKRVKVSGVMASYKGTPQIEVDDPAQVQVLSGGVAAQQVASMGGGISASRPPQRTSSGMPESVFDTLYAGRPASSSPVKAPPAYAPAQRPTKAQPVRMPTPPRVPAPPRVPTPKSARTTRAHVPRAGQTRKKSSGVFLGILVVLLLGVLGWVIWGLVSW